MVLPQPWMPVEQDDELAGLTESDIEKRVRALKAQLPQAQAHVQSDFSQITGDEQRIEMARQIAQNLSGAGFAPSSGLKAQADAILREESARTTADLQNLLEESAHAKWLHDEILYGEAWISACNYIRGLQRSALQHLTDALERLTATAGQLILPTPGTLILALPEGVQEFDVHLWQQKTVEMGKRISRETKDLTVKLLATPNHPEEKSNVVLRAAFKIAQFLYYSLSLARAGGDALMQGLQDFHRIFEKFMALLPATVK